MKNNLSILLLTIGLLGGCSKQSNAGEYYLIEQSHYIDKGRENICKDLIENFNKYRDEPPMVCERKFHSEFSEFVILDWKEVISNKYINDIERLLVDESNRPWKKGIPNLKNDIKNGKIKLWKALIDINFDGRKNVVYKLQKQKCSIENDYTRRNMPRYYFMVEKNDKKAKYKSFGGLNGWVYGGVFLYKNRPYFHSWKQRPIFQSEASRSVEGPSPRIAVYETSSPRTYESFAVVEKCEIGYRK